MSCQGYCLIWSSRPRRVAQGRNRPGARRCTSGHIIGWVNPCLIHGRRGRDNPFTSTIPEDILTPVKCRRSVPLQLFAAESLHRIRSGVDVKVAMGPAANARILDVSDFPKDEDLTVGKWTVVSAYLLFDMQVRGQFFAKPSIIEARSPTWYHALQSAKDSILRRASAPSPSSSLHKGPRYVPYPSGRPGSFQSGDGPRGAAGPSLCLNSSMGGTLAEGTLRAVQVHVAKGVGDPKHPRCSRRGRGLQGQLCCLTNSPD
jgi:hypothetical protein